MEKSYKQILIDAGRYEGVSSILTNLSILPGYQHPVSPYVKEDGTVSFDVLGVNLRNQASLLLRRLNGEQELGPVKDYLDLSLYVQSILNMMLHNYANHISHRIEPDVDMEDVRTWAVLSNLIDELAFCDEEWTIAEGWKASSNTPTMTM